MILLTPLIINLHLWLKIRKKSMKYTHKHFSDYHGNENGNAIFLHPTDKKEIANILPSLIIL